MANYEIRGSSVRIRVSLGYDIKGKQIIRRKTFQLDENLTDRQKEKEIQRLCVKFEEEAKHNYSANANMRLAEFADLWMQDHVRLNLKAKTINGYEKLMPFIINELGHMKLSDLRPTHLNGFYKKVIKRGNIAIEKRIKNLKEEIEIITKQKPNSKKLIRLRKEYEQIQPQPVSSSTVKAYHRVLSSMLEKAVQWEVIDSNPAKKADPPKVKQKEAGYLEEEDARKLLNLIDNQPIQFKTMIALYLFSGLRRGELLGVWWSDIDFKNEMVSIKRAVYYTKNKGVYEDLPKNDSSLRSIKLPSIAFDYLREYRKWQVQQRFIIGDQWKESDRIFTNDTGEYLFPDTITKRFANFIKKVDLPYITIHSLRHTCANLMIYTGTELKTVSSRLGHSNAVTTQRIYSHAFQSADEKAAENLNMLFDKESASF